MINKSQPSVLPKTVDEAVDRLTSELPMKSRIKLSKMSEEHLPDLRLTLGLHIRNVFRLDAGNRNLLESCREAAHDKYLHHSQAPYVIIKSLWKRLRETHKLRVVK